jgi:hypothetical protein
MDNGSPLSNNSKGTLEFSSFFLSRQLKLFRGPQDAEDVVSEFIKTETNKREKKAKNDGAPEPWKISKSIKPKVIRRLYDYLSLINKIGEFTSYRVGKEFAEGKLTIVQVRTDFDFRMWLVKMLFIIDAEPSLEPDFAKLLKDIENAVRLEEKFAPVLRHVNRRNNDIDTDSLRNDFPFVSKVRTKG